MSLSSETSDLPVTHFSLKVGKIIINFISFSINLAFTQLDLVQSEKIFLTSSSEMF